MLRFALLDAESKNRYNQWLGWYFPDPSYSSQDVRDFITNTNPNLPESNVDELVADWDYFALAPTSRSKYI